MKTVTVMMPCYNAAQYLEETLESLRAQKRELHLVVVDDGSTDKSVNIVRQNWPEALIVEGARKGIGRALNLALTHARGDYYAWVDADDLWLPGKLESQFEALEQNPDWDGCFVAVEQFFHSPRPGDHPPEAQGRHRGALLVDSEAFHRVGEFREDIKIGEFVDWCARAQQVGLSLGMLEQKLYRRRIHDTNTVKDPGVDKRDYLKILKAHLDRKRRG